MKDAVVIPSAIALLPAYQGQEDPVADARAASVEAVSWLVGRHPEGVVIACAGIPIDGVGRGVTEPSGRRIGESLLAAAGGTRLTAGEGKGLLVVANGSATRSIGAPGFLDERAQRFDEVIVSALSNGDAKALLALDEDLANELWCHDVPALKALAAHFAGPATANTSYVGDPYGVQYWVGTWTE